MSTTPSPCCPTTPTSPLRRSTRSRTPGTTNSSSPLNPSPHPLDPPQRRRNRHNVLTSERLNVNRPETRKGIAFPPSSPTQAFSHLIAELPRLALHSQPFGFLKPQRSCISSLLVRN